jgi:NAD(P)-dependent dehydrogenase (short-subunit alcohol dehydrogenase family)
MVTDPSSRRRGEQEAKQGSGIRNQVAARLLTSVAMTRTQQTALAAGALTLGAALLSRHRRGARAMDFNGSSVLITGGSRGLGLLMAREFGRHGARITLAARDEAELERARQDLASRGIDATAIVCDVGNREDAEELIRETVARTGRVDVLINNAGVIKVGPLDHMQRGDFEEAMAVHFWGPLHTMLAAIPEMRRHGGRIVNVSSIGGKIGVPHLTPYCASKFALTGLSDSVRGELARDGIYVTTVCPGMMRTGSPFNAWFKGRHREEFAWFAVSDSIPVVSIDGRQAAAQVVDACRRGDAELVITWPAKLAVVANAIMPESVALVMDWANRMLPRPTDASGDRPHSGWQSASNLVPSRLTRLTERAAAENNELPH